MQRQKLRLRWQRGYQKSAYLLTTSCVSPACASFILIHFFSFLTEITEFKQQRREQRWSKFREWDLLKLCVHVVVTTWVENFRLQTIGLNCVQLNYFPLSTNPFVFFLALLLLKLQNDEEWTNLKMCDGGRRSTDGAQIVVFSLNFWLIYICKDWKQFFYVKNIVNLFFGVTYALPSPSLLRKLSSAPTNIYSYLIS